MIRANLEFHITLPDFFDDEYAEAYSEAYALLGEKVKLAGPGDRIECTRYPSGTWKVELLRTERKTI